MDGWMWKSISGGAEARMGYDAMNGCGRYNNEYYHNQHKLTCQHLIF